jgi:hypothetical protein
VLLCLEPTADSIVLQDCIKWSLDHKKVSRFRAVQLFETKVGQVRSSLLVINPTLVVISIWLFPNQKWQLQEFMNCWESKLPYGIGPNKECLQVQHRLIALL